MGKLKGYLLSDRPIIVTVWTQHLTTLLAKELGDLIPIICQSVDHVRKHFLDLYRGRLAFVNGYYKEYQGKLGFNARQVSFYTWEGLFKGLKS